MTSDPESAPENNPDAAEDSPSTASPDATEAPSIEALQTELTAAQEEAESLRDAALRARADAENAKRRATKDVEAARRYALDKFCADLLPVADSLEKAADTASGAQGDEGLKAIAEGVSLSLKLFLDTLARHGLTPVDPLGEPFDPQHHEAMAMVPNPDAEPGSVMDVVQKGYVLNERLVRAAMVVVAQAPPGADSGDSGET